MADRATSTELTGGAGFTYEDTVVAYYLAALLREERAAPLNGIVKTVAVQQAGHGSPMDDVIVELDDAGLHRTLSLQVKRKITISGAPSNADFRDILSRAVGTRAKPDFQDELDAYGFIVENIAVDPLRSLQRIIDWAKSSPTGAYFATHFAVGGAAAEPERKMRDDLAPLLGIKSEDNERQFYAQFVAVNLDGLTEGGVLRTEVINRLQELVAANEDGQDLLLFDRLCRIAREAAGTARKWTRHTLLAQLRGAVRLRVAPNYKRDLDLLQTFSTAGVADISEDIVGFRVERPLLEQKIRERLTQARLVNISGLPGCGKSAMLKRIAMIDALRGTILFLKSDRLAGNSWLTFATALGVNHHAVADLLAEIGATGTPILFIDGIDRIPPNQRGVITDILRAIEETEQLSNWKVLASSRDQGLEAYRSWFPASFYRQSFIGDVTVSAFSDEEAKSLAEQLPNLYQLLFGAPAVSEIARRPFFAAVLAHSFPDNAAAPHTEVDLIAAWWDRAGHNTPEEVVPPRQRALLDLAEQGVRNLGKNIPARQLKDATIAQIAALKADHIIRPQDGGASYSFTHDIFFEWVFFRYLIELGVKWMTGLVEAGEPPLLGRVVGLLAQSALTTPGKWSTGYRELTGQPLRPQWRREWLTAAPFTPAFEQGKQEFQILLTEDDYALFEKLLVWFQAQHTIPSPVILQNPAIAVDGVDRASMAELLSWPSDFGSWRRFLDWLIPLAPSLPPKLLPRVLEVFGVWQNVFTDLKNSRSAAIIEVCSNWLIELEEVEYSEELKFEHGKWDALGSEARSSLATALRIILMRSARSYPTPAIALFNRAVTNEHMRREAYSDLMGFTPTMADVSSEGVVAVAKAELMEELPQDKVEREERKHREHVEYLKRLRAIPEKDRTDKQEQALNTSFFPIGRGSYDLDDFGIDRHHSYYFPTSALHEPFATLLTKKPEAALGLVRDLANHATKGWHQLQLMNRQVMGTPIPVTLKFPWGEQHFWGNWGVYSWFLGYLAPQPLECAFLALSHWAFKQIDAGRPGDEVIQAIVEGNECYAVLGLALVIALEVYDVSKTTLPLVICQRLWVHDIARAAQEPSRNVDLLGFGFLSRLTGAKAEAKEFLDSRESCKRNVQDLGIRFAVSNDHDVREQFKEALARFPETLPYELEEQRSHAATNTAFKEKAGEWAGLGDINNYRKQEVAPDEVIISYEPPKPLTPEREKRLEESTTSLQGLTVINWATKSLQENKIADGIKLEDAVAFAKKRDHATIFAQRLDVGAHWPQSAVSATAAVVIRFGPTTGLDCEWAWDVMDRVFVMKELDDAFPGSQIPWHPANHLVVGLFHDRRTRSPRKDSARQLLELTAHPIEGIAQRAFSALLRDSDEHVRWVAAQLAMDLAIYHHAEITSDGVLDNTADRNARKQNLAHALECSGKTEAMPFADVPPPWVKATEQRGARKSGLGGEWRDADPSFNPQYAAKLFSLFPIEAWCGSAVYKPMFEHTLTQLVTWTAERLMPSWCDEKTRRKREHRTTNLIEWNHVLGDLLARAAPFFETEVMRNRFLAPFLTDDEKGLAVLAAFADMTVTRQVFDAPVVPTNTLALLSDCIERVVHDPVFNPKSYRAGQLHGHDLPKLIDALLLVRFEKEASGAARFANGDWSQIGICIPLITRLVTATGWSVSVMQKFLTLCERAGTSYPLDAFSQQANAVLGVIANAKGSWAGTSLPARLAATVQRLADANYPLRVAQAQELLKVLDALIDQGDRRSAALEQTEAFKGVQGSAMPPPL